MNISSRCEYACRAIVELARYEKTAEPITAQQVATRRNIPEKYLVHILLQLKRAGLVKSVRGAQGGYLLAQPADRVTLLDIIRAIDGPVLHPLPVDDSSGIDLEITWGDVVTGIEKVLKKVTVRSILDRGARADMYYI